MNAENLLVDGLTPLVVLVLSWLMPTLTLPTVPFGVRIPPGRTDAPVITARRRRYRWQVGTFGAVVIVAAVVAPAVTGIPPAGPASLLVLMVCLVAYVRARAAIIAVKEREKWYEGLRRMTVADTSLRTEPERYPWPLAVPPLLVVIGTAVWGIVRYPSLPDRLPTHFTGSGAADHWAAKSVGTAFLPVFTQVGTTALILAVTWLAFRSRPDLDPDRPAGSAHRHRRFSVQVVASALVLTALVDLSALAAAWQIWHPGTRRSPLLVVLPALLGLLVVVVVAIRTGQAGSRLPAGEGGDGEGDEDGTARATGVVHADDDRHWRAGLLYVNRADPAVFVQKRFGVGWTINFGNPRGVALLAALLALAVVVPLVAR